MTRKSLSTWKRLLLLTAWLLPAGIVGAAVATTQDHTSDNDDDPRPHRSSDGTPGALVSHQGQVITKDDHWNNNREVDNNVWCNWWRTFVHRFIPPRRNQGGTRLQPSPNRKQLPLPDVSQRRVAKAISVADAALVTCAPHAPSDAFANSFDGTQCDSDSGTPWLQALPHVGMRLQTITPPKLDYLLMEEVDYALGSEKNQKYQVDYAYRPVQVTAEATVGRGDIVPLTTESVGYTTPGHTTASDKIPMETSPHARQWWQWWWRPSMHPTPNNHAHGPKEGQDPQWNNNYRTSDRAFAGGSHGEVWRGRRLCQPEEQECCGETRSHADQDQTMKSSGETNKCQENVILKRLRVEHGFRLLEAGLREVHFGQRLAQQTIKHAELFTHYLDHFFRTLPNGELELWIVFADAGPSLRSYLYTAVSMGDFVVYQPSELWTRIRLSMSNAAIAEEMALENNGAADSMVLVGRRLMSSVLRQVLEAAARLHEHGIVHRDIKPSNVMCVTNLDVADLDQANNLDQVSVNCVLGDLSSAWDDYSRDHLYTRGPSRLEQTDEYAPPEAIFGQIYRSSKPNIDPSFDSWSIGVLALEMLLGSPKVFSVDQRTTALLTHKLKKEGATDGEIQHALYLAALSQFCIFNPSFERRNEWPLRHGDPLHQSAMVKSTCTLHDFHRGLLARDPLGLGFDSSIAPLLHLIWQLLAWDPKQRITPAEALSHPYFTHVNIVLDKRLTNEPKALESQMLDPRMDFNVSDSVNEFSCPKCGRVFEDWNSCLQHARSRKHAKRCHYDRSILPTCLHAHSMLPVHNMSGYCDIQGRRKTIEDFHSIHLANDAFYYGIFDGHCGNFAAKYVASTLYDKLETRLRPIVHHPTLATDWKQLVERSVSDLFEEIHEEFLYASRSAPRKMNESGTTATVVYVTSQAFVVASIGDSRAVLGLVQPNGRSKSWRSEAIQLTTDHVASVPDELRRVQEKGGQVILHNGMYRVNGTLAITRSIGDATLSPYLSREPNVISMSTDEVDSLRMARFEVDYEGQPFTTNSPCFLILASDGLWDMMSNEEAVDMVSDILMTSPENPTALQQAAEALTLESYVRGSRDNIGVAVIAL